MQIRIIWNPVKFIPEWTNVITDKFDNIYPFCDQMCIIKTNY